MRRGVAAVGLLLLAAELPAEDPAAVEDVIGNWRGRVPAGWRMDQRPSGDPEAACRLAMSFRDDDGKIRAQLIVDVYRARANKGARQPPEGLLRLAMEAGLLEEIYGPHAPSDIPLDAASKLGKLENSAGFRIEALTSAERKRGQAKGEALTLGRVGGVAPLTYAVLGVFDITDKRHTGLIEEWQAFVSSFEAIRPEPRPALPSFDDKFVEITTTDAFLKKPREESLLVGVQDSSREQKGLVVEYVLPAGFRKVRARNEPGELVVAAVDEDHNWAYADLYVMSWKKVAQEGRRYVAPQEAIKDNLAEWATSAGAKTASLRPVKLPLGKLSAWGYKGVEGAPDLVPATESFMVVDEDRWRIQCRVRTSGEGHKVFAGGIDAFLKSLKFRRE